MDWINANAPDRCDRFKSLAAFKKAWLAFAKYRPSDCSLYRTVHIDDMRLFLRAQIRPWKKAVKAITGKPDETKATAAFRRFYFEFLKGADAKFPIRMDDDGLKQRVADHIAHWKGDGMKVEEIEKMRRIYQTSPRRARRPRKK